MKESDLGSSERFLPPAWLLGLIVGIFAVGTATLIVAMIAKENRFHNSYAQARTDISQAMGSPAHAEVVQALFDRADKCRDRGKLQLGSSGIQWSFIPFRDIEDAGRQTAQDCFLAQVNSMEASQDSELMAKMRAAAQ